MKVMFINHDANEKGGASKSLINMVICLQKKYGIQPIVILPKKGELANQFISKGVDVKITRFYWWQIPKRFSHFKRLAIRILRVTNRISLIRLKKICKQEKVDLIHSNSSVIDIGMELSCITSIPHIWHFREFGDLDLKLEYILGKEKSLQRINESNSRVVAISKAIREYYKELVNVSICYNGVGQENIYSQFDMPLNKDANIIVTGRYSPEKGQMEVLHVAKRLIDNGIRNFRINMYGDSLEKSFIEKLHAYVKNNNIENYVKINGFSNDIHEVRKVADIEIVCSKAEAFGRVIVEAMKSSCVVVASNTGACPELIEHGVNGLLFEYGNEKDLLEKIEILLNDRKLLTNMMIEAFNSSKNSFTIETNADDINKIYKEVMK